MSGNLINYEFTVTVIVLSINNVWRTPDKCLIAVTDTDQLNSSEDASSDSKADDGPEQESIIPVAVKVSKCR